MNKAIQLKNKEGDSIFPIGAKVEEDNKNNTYRRAVKYADGMLINTIKELVLWSSYTINSTTSIPFSFLTAFSELPTITHSINIANNNGFLQVFDTNLQEISATGGNLLVTHRGTTGNRISFYANIIAIGRWK